ncbi:uncharacterized protein [Littorina saxatilis]|uniref:Uncharacterized protein n=1 Tax=Littorina saxatilis TaxID=31220 RepID=A0AAN9G0I7_9CAEN
MKIIIGLALCAFAAGQLGSLLDQLRDRFQTGTGEGDAVDTLHGWRLEYHYGGDHHVLLFINDHRVSGHRYCYVVPVGKSWENLMQDKVSVERITDELYALLKDPDHSEHQLRPTDLGTDYHHFDAARECRGHDTYDISYTPSFA